MRIFPAEKLLEDKLKYDFFISYSHKDKALALDIHYLAMANNLHSWIDDRQIDYGDVVTETALLGIHNSKKFLVIYSEEAKQSSPVQTEISEALELKAHLLKLGKDFKIVVYRLGEVEVPENLNKYLYAEDRSDHPLPASIKIIQSLTGKDLLAKYLTGAHATHLQVGIFPEPGSYMNLFASYCFTVLTQVNTFLNNMALGHHPSETLPAIQQLVSTSSLLGEVPQFSTWLAMGNGIFELIHPIKMAKTPEIRIIDLPMHVKVNEILNNEVVTRIQFVHKETNKPILEPFAFRIDLES